MLTSLILESLLILIAFLFASNLNHLLQFRLLLTQRFISVIYSHISLKTGLRSRNNYNKLLNRIKSKEKDFKEIIKEINQLNHEIIDLKKLNSCLTADLEKKSKLGQFFEELEREKEQLQTEKEKLEKEKDEFYRKRKTFFKTGHSFTKRVGQWSKSSDSSTQEKKPGRGKLKGKPGGGRIRPRDLSIYDEVISVVPTRCSSKTCGISLDPEKKCHSYYYRHVIDLVKEKRGTVLKVILYKVHRKYCPKCHTLVSGNSDVPAFPGYIYGYGYMAFALMGRIQAGMLQEKITIYFDSLFEEEFNASPNSLNTWLKKVHQTLQPTMEQLLKELNESPWVKVDETGLPLDGKKGWMWIFCSKLIRLYVVSDNRSHQTPAEILQNFEGTIVSDFFSAYAKLPFKKAKCHVHLIRTIDDLLNGYVRDIGKLTKKLAVSEEEKLKQKKKEQTRKQKASPSSRKTKTTRTREIQKTSLSRSNTKILTPTQVRKIESQLKELERVCTLTSELFHFLIDQDKENWTDTQCRAHFDNLFEQALKLSQFKSLLNIFKRIDKYWIDLFRYKTDISGKEIKENNLAEDTVKGYASLRRTHGTWRSWAVADSIATILSVYKTLQLQEHTLNNLSIWTHLVKGTISEFLTFTPDKG